MTAVAPRIFLSSPQISFNYFTILSVLGVWAVGLDNKINTDYIILNVYKSNNNVCIRSIVFSIDNKIKKSKAKYINSNYKLYDSICI